MKTASSIRIFLVDDDPFCLELYRHMLTNLGQHDIHLFCNSQDCLDSLSLDPDLVVLDNQMAPFNGVDTLKKIKHVAAGTQVVIISGDAGDLPATRVFEHGALALIAKSELSEERLRVILDKVIGIRTASKYCLRLQMQLR